MKTKIEHVNSAYSKMRISGLTVQPTPEDLETALIRLEGMMALFYGSTLDVGYIFEEHPDGNSPSGVSIEHDDMIASNLAIKLLSDFGKTATPELAREARGSLANTNAIVARERLKKVAYPNRMPRGSGNRNWNRYHHYYPQTPQVVTDASNERMYQGDIDDFFENFATWLSANGGQIDNYDIAVTPGLTLISSSENPDFSQINYRLQANDNNTGGSNIEVVTITIISTQGRKESRQRVFEIDQLVNDTNVSPSVPPVPPSLFSATVTAVDLSTPLEFSTDQDFTVDWGDGNRVDYGAGTTAVGTSLGVITFQSSFPATTATFGGGAQTIDVTESSTITSMLSMFSTLPDLLTLNIADTSNVTNMSTAFPNNPKLTAIPFMDTSKVTTMGGAFGGSIALTTIPALDFSAVVSMHQAFDGCTGLTSMPAFNTSSMEFCTAMFRNCSSLVCLTSIDMSVTQAGFTTLMFDGCTSLVAPDATDQNNISTLRQSWTNPAPCP